MIADGTRRYLLALARQSLATAVGVRAPDPARPADPVLEAPARAFVSWHAGERLVGCLGTLDPVRSLEDAVRHFAVQAGLHDPRTPAVTPPELPTLDCEVSVLSEPVPLPVVGLDRIELLVEPGRDGVILRAGARRSVFLPVVWNAIPDRRAFLEALCRKGGFEPTQTEPPIEGELFVAERFADAVAHDGGAR